MRGLRLFGLLGAGVVTLVGCWLAAFATLAAWMLLNTGTALWALLGIPLVVVLLAFGFGLALAFEEDVAPDPASSPTSRALMVFFLTGCGALVVAGSVLHFSGGQIYHAHFGERTEAVVTSIMEFNGESGGVVNRWFYVRDSTTGESLGPLATPPADGAAEGDRIAVSVDPGGWMRPVPADSTGWTTVPSAILLCSAGVVALGALGVMATGLGVLITRRPR